MSLGFKRVISSIMAFVMMVSTLVMVNVTGVSAAQTESSWLATESLPSWLTFGGNFAKGQITSSSATASFEEAIFGSDSTATGAVLNQEAYISGDSKGTFSVTTTAANATLKLYAVRSSSNSGSTIKSVTAAGSGVATNVTGSTDIAGRNTATPIKAIEYTFDVADTYTFTFGNSGVAICKLVLTDEVGTSYSWILNIDNLQIIDPLKVSIDVNATGKTNTLSYSGTDYVVKNANLAEGVEGVTLSGNVFTVTVTDDMFLPVTENMSISIANAGRKTLKLVGTTNGYTFNIPLDESGNATGIALVQDTYTMSIDGGTLTTGSVTVGSGTTNITDTFTPNEIVAFKNTLNVSDLAIGDITSETLSSDKYFKFIASADEMLTVEENLKTFNIDDGTEVTVTNRFKTNGKGAYDNQAIQFKTSEAGKIYVYAMAGNSTAIDRPLAISDGVTETIATNVTDGTKVTATVFDVEANKTYSLYSSNSGINIYYIGSTAQLAAFDEEVSSDTTTTTETTTETTTVTTTEETTTETTTEAPVTPGEGYVAMGSYDLNESVITDKETFEYEEMIFSNLNSIEVDHIRLNEGSSVSFKVAESCTLTLTFTSNDLQISGGNYTNELLDRENSPVTVNLEPNVEYTISGVSGNARLSNLTFATGGTSEETTEGTTAEVTETTTEAVTGDEIRVPISITGNSGDIKININGTDRTFGADETIELYLTEGSEIKFDFATDVANKIVGWEGLDVDSYVNNTHEYFSATATTSGVHFTYNADAQTAIDEDFAVAGSDVVLDYGNYGYGDNKGTAPGATQAESVAALNSVSGVVTLREFLGGGYKTNDQRLILNNNDQTGASFTVEGAGYLIIDCGRGTPKVTVNGETVTATAIGDSGKQGYALEAGDKVVITKGTTNGDSMQLKSIRFQTDGNVFNNVSGTAGTAVVDYDTLDDEAKAELGTVPEGKVFARIVGSLNTNLVDADTVGTVGMLVIKKSSVDSAISASDNFAPAQSLEVEGAINLEESEALYDGIYDGNAAVDGEYNLDPNTAYSDGIYYMLRYVALDPEEYYVFPYTVESGSDTPVFDFSNAVADTDLSSYMLDASAY